MSEQRSRVTWEEGRYTTKNGSAGGVRLFSISWRSRREDPNWLMRCDLPGFAGRGWKNDEVTVLQEKAERLLDEWLRNVGSQEAAPEGGDTTVVIARSGGTWRWRGYADNRTDALAQAQLALDEELSQ